MCLIHEKHRVPGSAAGFLALLGARENHFSVPAKRNSSFHVGQGALVFALFLQVVSHIFQKAKAAYSQHRELGARSKGLKPQASTLVSKFQQSLQDLTARLRRWEIPLRCHPCTGLTAACRSLPKSAQGEDDPRFFLLFCRSHVFFIRCISPNPQKVGQHPRPPDGILHFLEVQSSPAAILSQLELGLLCFI